MINYLEKLYYFQKVRFDADKIKEIIENSPNDVDILSHLRHDLSPEPNSKQKENDAFAIMRAKKRAIDISWLLPRDIYMRMTNKKFQPRYMDFGGADGAITTEIAKKFNIPKKNTYCVDFETWENMHHDESRGKYANNMIFVPIREGEKDIPMAENSIDLITCLQVLHHLPDPVHTIKEFHRILDKGGVVCIREHDSRGEIDNKMFDLIHVMYEIVLSEKENWDYVKGAQPVYRSQEGWRKMFLDNGFRSIKENKPVLKYEDPNRVFYEAFQKI